MLDWQKMGSSGAGDHVAKAARLERKQPPELYTIARDGAMHSFVYITDPSSKDTPSSHTPGSGSSSGDEGHDTDMTPAPDHMPYVGTKGLPASLGRTLNGESFGVAWCEGWRLSLCESLLPSSKAPSCAPSLCRNLTRPRQSCASDSCITPFLRTPVLEGLLLSGTAGGHWKLHEKFYFNHRGAKASAADWHIASGMLVVAFSNGIFDLYEMPAFQSVHTLSVSRQRITATAFNTTGNLVLSSFPTFDFVCLFAINWDLQTCVYDIHDRSRVPSPQLPQLFGIIAFHGSLLTWLALGSFFATLGHPLPLSGHALHLRLRQEDLGWLQVAVGCATLGQLLVWDWRAETYVLKQQGHYHDVSAVAYSPDGALLATGADDSKVPPSSPSRLEHFRSTDGCAFKQTLPIDMR